MNDPYEFDTYEVCWSVKIRNKFYKISTQTEMLRVCKVMSLYLGLTPDQAYDTLLGMAEAQQWAIDCDSYAKLIEQS